MAQMKIEKLTALPSTLVANTIYMLPHPTDANFMEIYVVDNAGVATRRIPTEQDIQGWIAAAVTGLSTLEVVADIAARDALSPTSNVLVLVKDASADPSVDTATAATYVYELATDTYEKISEFESLDLVLDWANIQNGPASTPAAIDAAVNNSHTHANLTELNKISEPQPGCPEYGGEGIVLAPGTVAW